MRFRRLTKQEKKEREEKKIRELLLKLVQLRPQASDLYALIHQVSNERANRFIVRMFLRKASIDDLFCLARFKEKHRAGAWKALCRKLKPEGHSRIILLHIAEEIPDLAVPALEQIKRLNFVLSYGEITHLLSLMHIQLSQNILEELEKLKEEQYRKSEAIDAVSRGIIESEERIKELGL